VNWPSYAATHSCHRRLELGPCSPQRAAWFSRQTLTLNFGILTAGLLLLCMSLPQRESIFVPGGLAKDHAQILGNHLVSERCSLCHPNSHGDLRGSPLQDDLCIQCHQSHLPDTRLRSPHDVPHEQLVKLTAKANPFAELSSAHPVSQTSCAMCHVEHRGANFDLTAVSDASCQACHQQRFKSLAEGHPAFEGFPYRSQRRIAFDHAAHKNKHFGTKNETFECRRCHVDDQRPGGLGSIFRSVGFEQSCGSCHQPSIQAASIDGWAILQLPSIEAGDSVNAQQALADWPTSARFGYEGQIDVPLRLLLAADSALEATLAKLPPSGQLQHIANAEERGSVTRDLARGLRKLIHEVAADGQAAWQRRLLASAQRQLARELTPHELKLVAALSQGVPPDLFRQMEATWFSDAATGVALRLLQGNSGNQGAPLHMISQIAGDDTLLSETENDSLLGQVDDNDLLSQEDSDSLLSGAGNDLPLEGTSNSSAASNSRLTALRGSQHVTAGGWYLDHELLALRYMPRGHADPTLAAWAEFIALLDASAATTQPTHSDDARVAQHADSSRLTHGLPVPGGCTQCHLLHVNKASLDSTTPWTSLTRKSNVRLFTKFDHTPHLTLPKLEDCGYCHQFNDRQTDNLQTLLVALRQSANGVDTPQQSTETVCQFLSDEFIDMRIEQCAACHRSGGASESCTQCHHYHVGTSGMNGSK
jgi:hypothetical protein